MLVAGALVLASAIRAQDAGSESAAAEQDLFRLTNQARAQAGVPQLEWNEWLAQAARKHAAETARRGQLSHQFPGEPGMRDRIAATGLRFNASAENVAFGPSAAEIQDDWMHSPPHRANLLDGKYNAVGIAVVRQGNTMYAVSDFAHTVPAQSAGDVEDEVANAINRARAKQKLPPLARRSDPQLRAYACQMAKDGRVNANGLLGHNGITATFAFTDSDPSKFGSHFQDARKLSGYRAFGVGACFGRNPNYPEGTNWIAVAFY